MIVQCVRLISQEGRRIPPRLNIQFAHFQRYFIGLGVHYCIQIQQYTPGASHGKHRRTPPQHAFLQATRRSRLAHEITRLSAYIYAATSPSDEDCQTRHRSSRRKAGLVVPRLHPPARKPGCSQTAPEPRTDVPIRYRRLHHHQRPTASRDNPPT